MINTSKMSKNIKMGGICKVISTLLSFIYVPIALNYMGEERYGIWAVILSVLSWIEYMDIGIGNGLRNKLAEKFGLGHIKEARQFISSAYILLSIIMFVVFIVFIGSYFVVDYNTFFNAREIKENLNVVMLVCVFLTCLNFILALFKSIMFAAQRAYIVFIIGVLNQASVLVFFFIAAKFMKPSLVIISILYGLSNIIFNLLYSVYFFSHNPQLCPSLKRYNKEKAKETVSLGIKFLIIQIAALILFATDNIIITKLYGPVYVTYYSTVNKVFMIIATAYNAMVTPLWSAFTLAKVQNNIIWIKESISKLLIYMLPVGVGTIILAIIFKPLSALWLQRVLQYPKGLVFLMAVYIIIYIWCSGFSMITNGMEMINIAVIIAIIQAIINIPLSLFFSEVIELGICGVLLGSIVSMLIAAVVIPIKVIYIIKNMEGAI